MFAEGIDESCGMLVLIQLQNLGVFAADSGHQQLHEESQLLVTLQGRR